MTMAAPASAFTRLRMAVLGAMALASLPMFLAYPGQVIVLFAFCLAAIALFAAASFGRLSYFALFLACFLILGFWAKLDLYWVLGTPLLEPVGSFPDTAEAWDRALLASTAGLAGLAAGIGAAKLLDRRNLVPDFPVLAAPAPGPALGVLFALSAAAAVALFVANFHYAILKIGTVPRIPLHPYLYAIVSFTVGWGAALWLGTLAFWMVGARRAPADFPVYVLAVEGAAAALSMGSRAQMILHMAACLAALATCMRAFGWRVAPLRLLLASGFAALLFAASLVGVSLDRISSFYGPPPPSAAKRAEAPSGGGIGADRPAGLAPSGAVSDAAVRRMAGEVMQLFVGRWIGIEGVLAVSSHPDLGPDTLRAGFSEDPRLGVDTMYQRLARSIYKRSEQFVFLTVPGPIAVLFYGGSMTLVAFGMAVLFLAGYAVERFCDSWVRNPASSAVVGAALAYLVAQTMFPRTLLYFSVELVLALALIGGFRMGVRRWAR